MGILYNVPSATVWGIGIFVLFALMAFNEFGRTTKWGGLVLFLVVPVFMTIFVWPKTNAFGNEYGTGTWFTWVKTYSALAGALGFMAIRFIPGLAQNKWALRFPPFILALNILEACIRDFQVFSFGFWNGGYSDNLWLMSGPWNIMNGIAGLLNIITICGWAGIFVSKDSSKDMIWPDMIWAWVIAYDLWNFTYVYNCLPTHSWYAGFALLFAATLCAFTLGKGAWLQHRAATLAIWCMFAQTFPKFLDQGATMVVSTYNTAIYTFWGALSLASNVAVLLYMIYRVIKTKRNPYLGELYTDLKAYKAIKALAE
uniref:Uncharacterized protein n=1 Tax=Gracilinema caldarium TaxID=215591 RepID=A0A7C3HX35_9SPIR